MKLSLKLGVAFVKFAVRFAVKFQSSFDEVCGEAYDEVSVKLLKTTLVTVSIENDQKNTPRESESSLATETDYEG